MASDLSLYGKEKPLPLYTADKPWSNRYNKKWFEAASTRTAVKGPKGEVHRGSYLHHDVYSDIAMKEGRSFGDVVDDAYDPITDKPTGKYVEGFSKGQEGKFVTRAEAESMSGLKAGEKGFFTSEESARYERQRAKKDPGAGRRETRAGGSADPADQARRRTRAKRTHGYLEKMKAEEKLLKGPRPNPRKSPEALRKLELDAKTAIPGASKEFRGAVRNRLQLIDRRKGVLKALGKKAGLLGLVASPYTTGEALVGLGSKDKNDRLRAVELLQGLPDFSTGRGMTDKEKKETPIWNDPTTGEWKL